jgi:hypothetical protein
LEKIASGVRFPVVEHDYEVAIFHQTIRRHFLQLLNFSGVQCIASPEKRQWHSADAKLHQSFHAGA